MNGFVTEAIVKQYNELSRSIVDKMKFDREKIYWTGWVVARKGGEGIIPEAGIAGLWRYLPTNRDPGIYVSLPGMESGRPEHEPRSFIIKGAKHLCCPVGYDETEKLLQDGLDRLHAFVELQKNPDSNRNLHDIHDIVDMMAAQKVLRQKMAVFVAKYPGSEVDIHGLGAVETIEEILKRQGSLICVG